MNKRIAFGLGVLSIVFVVVGSCLAQEEKAGGPDTEQIQDAAKKLFRGIANSDMATIFENTDVKYANRKLTPDKLRLPATGPKLDVAWDSSVTVVRSDGKTAIAEANFFRPESSDIPEQEVKRLRLFLIKKGGAWVASAPNRKQADNDANISGGWYHAGLFTFCPNKGIVFLPNHFSVDTQCETVAQCREF